MGTSGAGRYHDHPWNIGVDTSELEVERWARDDDLRKHKYVLRPDDEIRRAVVDALPRDPRVSSFDVAATVDGGVVPRSPP